MIWDDKVTSIYIYMDLEEKEKRWGTDGKNRLFVLAIKKSVKPLDGQNALACPDFSGNGGERERGGFNNAWNLRLSCCQKFQFALFDFPRFYFSPFFFRRLTRRRVQSLSVFWTLRKKKKKINLRFCVMHERSFPRNARVIIIPFYFTFEAVVRLPRERSSYTPITNKSRE